MFCVFLHTAKFLSVLPRDKLWISLESLAARINISLPSVAVGKYSNYELRAHTVNKQTKWKRFTVDGKCSVW